MPKILQLLKFSWFSSFSVVVNQLSSSILKTSLNCFFPLQAYSCGKWRSSESKRLSTSVLAMTWPPSCHAASPWSTLTPRTSPSSTKETGWSDDDQGESKRSSAGSRGQTCSGAPHPQTLDKSENTVVTHFSSVELFYLIISVSRCRLCLEGNLHVVLVRLSSVSKRSSCIQSFLHYHMTLFLLDFLWWNPPCLLLLYMKRTFLKNHLFLFLICK